MKTNFSKWIIGIALLLSSSLSFTSDGTDRFSTTQSTEIENFNVTCTSTFAAPYNDIRSY